jgi:hypothetical protein
MIKRLTVLLLLLLLPNFAEAKRVPPPRIEPLIYKGIKFIAPSERMGYVEAWDIATDRKVWEKKVYTIFINPFLEPDVQWVFIVSLGIKDGRLLVIDERGRRYNITIPKRILKYD